MQKNRGNEARRESTSILFINYTRSIHHHSYLELAMQHQLQINLDALNNHGFGRADRELPAYANDMVAALPANPSANDDDGYVDLAQRVRECGEW